MKLKNKIAAAFLAYLLTACTSSNVREAGESQSFAGNTKENYKIEKIEERKNEINEDLGILYGMNDPLSPINRRLYYFNGMADRYVLKPAVTTYKYYTPDFFQKRVSNFFTNFGNISTALNSFLQFKFTQGMETVFRFAINSTVGILGLFDPATSMGFPKHKENLGMTLAHYGVKRGPYVVAPFLGPSNVRDLSAFAVNSYGVNRLDVYHPVDIDFGDWYMTAIYGFSTKADTGIYFMDTDYVFEYEYARFLSKKYNDLLEKKSKNR